MTTKDATKLRNTPPLSRTSQLVWQSIGIRRIYGTMDFLFARFLLYSVQCDCMPVHVRDGVSLLQACVRTKFVCGGVDFGRATVVTLQLFFFYCCSRVSMCRQWESGVCGVLVAAPCKWYAFSSASYMLLVPIQLVLPWKARPAMHSSSECRNKRISVNVFIWIQIP